MMDEAIRVEDIKKYILRRRNYLSARRDTVDTPADKGKIIGMLQALTDFEGMIRQLRVIPASSVVSFPVSQILQKSCDDLVARWLSALDLPDVCIDDFQNDKRQNRVIARHPDRKEGIVSLGQLLRNKGLIDIILSNQPAQVPHAPVRDSVTPVHPMTGNGSTCPYCGKAYKYAKALETHVAGCPRKSSS